jgi:hypothetical protein
VDTPGITSPNTLRFAAQYKHIRRPIFPLDDFEWDGVR